LTASRQLSVPPEVTDPTAFGPFSTVRPKATSSDSMSATDGKVVGSSPLTGSAIAAARAARSSKAASPLS